MKSNLRIAATYIAIASLAGAINIATQMVAVQLYRGPHYVHVSIAAGLAAALPVKYLLEKMFVFSFVSDDVLHDARLFAVYTALGAGTTLIFLGVEYLFHYAFDGDAMRYVGAALGLALGNFLKYHLDKHLVFRTR